MVAEIVTGKSIPAMKRRGARPKYPWLQLKPGQAFRFDADVTFAGARSMASAHTAGATAKWKFIVREAEDGIWCWRVDGTQHELQNGNTQAVASVVEGYDPHATKAKRAELVSDRPLPAASEEDGDVI